MADKENQETSQDESRQDGMPFLFVPQFPDAFFEEARKREAQLEARLRRIERALGLPEEDSFAQGKPADIDALTAENKRLSAIEASVLQMAHHLRNGFWWPSTETGAALEIHSAITGLHVDMEELAAERDKLKEEVKALRKAKGELVVEVVVDDIRSGGSIGLAISQIFGLKRTGR